MTRENQKAAYSYVEAKTNSLLMFVLLFVFYDCIEQN